MKRWLFLLLIFFPAFAFASTGNSFHQTTLLFVAVVAAAKIMGILCEAISIPSLVGEIFGGILLGNLALFGIHYDVTDALLTSPFFVYAAELGVVFLLFLVGLESNLGDLMKVGVNSFVTATIGVIVPSVLGYLVVKSLGIGNNIEAMFVGATFAATSVGITAKVFTEAKKLKTKSAQIVLGAAVVDDVMGLILLAALGGLVDSGSFDMGNLGIILFKVFVFFAAAILFGQYVMPHGFRVWKSIDQPGILTIMAVVIALLFADLAYLAGLAPIVGAFTAGLLLDDVNLRHASELTTHKFEEVIKPITDFLLPVFFVSIGIQVNLGTLFDLHNLTMILVLLGVALVGKAVCGFACTGKGIDKIGIGLGMIPRGEVGLIFATFGLSHGIVSKGLYSDLVLVVLLTTIIGPVLLKSRLKHY